MKGTNGRQMALILIVTAGFFPAGSAWAGQAGVDTNSVRRLPEEQILSQTREDMITALVGKHGRPQTPSELDKRIILNSWDLVAYRPSGERLAATGTTRRAIVREVQKHFGQEVADEGVLPFMEMYSDLIPGSVREEAEKRWQYRPESQKGDVYFIPFQKGPYHVFIIGELGSFVSVFVKSLRGKSTYETVLADLFPHIDVADIASSPRSDALTIWAGETTGPDGTFYRVRVNMETGELVAGVDLHGLYWWRTAIVPLDAVMERSGASPVCRETVVGEGMSVVRTGEGPMKEELSIAPQSNFKRLGAYIGIVPEEGERVTKTVQCGVYGDPNEALRAFRDHLEHAAISPRDIPRERPGQRSAGWRHEQHSAFDRILFMRDNVVVDFRQLDDHDPPDDVTQAALVFDMHLRPGDRALYGIQAGPPRTDRVQVPRIVAVEMPSEAMAGSTVEAKVHIAVPDKRADLSGTDKEVEITRTIRFVVPATSSKAADRDGNQMTSELTYITADCRVASRNVTLTVKPTVPSVADKKREYYISRLPHAESQGSIRRRCIGLPLRLERRNHDSTIHFPFTGLT